MKIFHRAFLMLSMLIVAAALTGGAAPSPSSGGTGGTVPPSSVPAIPEPAALAVFGVGAAIVGVAIHRRRKH